MNVRTLSLTAALAATTLLPAAAAENVARRTFTAPAVVGVGFHDFAVATTPDEVQRQGGYAVPAAVTWLPAKVGAL